MLFRTSSISHHLTSKISSGSILIVSFINLVAKIIAIKISSSITLFATVAIPVNSTSQPVSSFISLRAPSQIDSFGSKCPAGRFHFP